MLFSFWKSSRVAIFFLFWFLVQTIGVHATYGLRTYKYSGEAKQVGEVGKVEEAGSVHRKWSCNYFWWSDFFFFFKYQSSHLLLCQLKLWTFERANKSIRGWMNCLKSGQANHTCIYRKWIRDRKINRIKLNKGEPSFRQMRACQKKSKLG